MPFDDDGVKQTPGSCMVQRRGDLARGEGRRLSVHLSWLHCKSRGRTLMHGVTMHVRGTHEQGGAIYCKQWSSSYHLLSSKKTWRGLPAGLSVGSSIDHWWREKAKFWSSLHSRNLQKKKRKRTQVAKVSETCHEKGYMLPFKDYKMSAASWRLT